MIKFLKRWLEFLVMTYNSGRTAEIAGRVEAYYNKQHLTHAFLHSLRVADILKGITAVNYGRVFDTNYAAALCHEVDSSDIGELLNGLFS